MLNLFKVDGKLAPRRVMAATSLACVGMLAFAIYLQISGGLNPCPMCIVQRYALIVVAVLAAWASASEERSKWFISGTVLALFAAGFGAFVAARQSWLQWYPPEFATCGRDLYGMIETFPLKNVIPMIFKGGGDCAAVDWTLLGGSIANWSFLCFSAMVLVFLAVLGRRLLRG